MPVPAYTEPFLPVIPDPVPGPAYTALIAIAHTPKPVYRATPYLKPSNHRPLFLYFKHMRISLFLLIPVACNFIGCATHVSSQQTMADDRNLVYEDTYKAYREAEKNYMNLLFNIERMPEEEELWVMKRERMLELMQLKELMLNARLELDGALQEWEKHLLDVQADVKSRDLKKLNPNFKGRDAQRTSPGQLLPGENNKTPSYNY